MPFTSKDKKQVFIFAGIILAMFIAWLAGCKW